MRKNILLSALILICYQATAAIYYVDFSNGNDINSGLSISNPWKTLSRVNSFSFVPGDQVLFKRGEKWQGALAPIASGTAGEPITFGAYGSGVKPIITAAEELIGPWTSLGSNRWSMPLAVQTRTMIFDGIERGRDAGGSTSGLLDAPYEFYWSSGTLYVYAASNPSITYSSVEAGQGTYCVSSNNQAYLVFDNLAVYGGQGTTQTTSVGGGFFVSPGSHHVIVQNNDAYLCQGSGVRVHGADFVTIHGNMINDIDSHDVQTSGDGISVTWDPATQNIPEDLIITANTINTTIDRQGIAVINGDGVVISGNFVYAGRSGIDIEPNDGSGNKVLNVVISNNIIDKYHNEPSALGNAEEGTNGIAASGEISYNIQIMNNQINMQNHPDGLGISLSDWGTLLSTYPAGGTFGLIEGNIVKNARWGIRVSDHYALQKINVNANYIETSIVDASSDSRAIYLKLNSKTICTNNIIIGPYSYTIHARNDAQGEIYHNVFYNYDYRGLYVRDNGSLTVKNNIFYSNQCDFHFLKQATTSTLITNRNIYYPSGSYYRWNSVTYSMAALRSTTGQEEDGIEADPLFLNGSGGFDHPEDFSLLTGSPAIDAAEDVNVNTDYSGIARVNHPDAPNTGTQGNFNINYADRGAFESTIFLPIVLVQFDAHAGDNHINISWVISIEKEAFGRLYLERASETDPTSFVKLKEIPLVDNEHQQHYLVKDLDVKPGIQYYYRILHINDSGKKQYFPTISSKIESNDSALKVFPNPTSENIFIVSDKELISKVELLGANGNILTEQNGESTDIILKIPKYSSGTYFIRITKNNKTLLFPVIKQ